MHIFCLDYTVSVSKSYPLRVQNKLTTSGYVVKNSSTASGPPPLLRGGFLRAEGVPKHRCPPESVAAQRHLIPKRPANGGLRAVRRDGPYANFLMSPKGWMRL